MKERPILFSGPMVRAILEGRKTQTRRIVQPQPELIPDISLAGKLTGSYSYWWYGSAAQTMIGVSMMPQFCPYGNRGEKLWVRETFCEFADYHIIDGKRFAYRADSEHLRTFADSEQTRKELGYKWKPSIFMPRHASRITLEIVNVRVERLRDISEDDAKAEGIRELPLQEGEPGAWWSGDVMQGSVLHGRSPVMAFRKLWDSINKDRAPWESDPWVWILEFRRIEK